MTGFRFDIDTAVHDLGDGRFGGTLERRWTIAGIPNGGYAMGMMLRACRERSGHPDPLSATAHFLSPTAPGEVEITTETVKEGRSSSTFQASLRQSGRERIRLLTTFADLEGRQGPDHLFLEPPRIEPPFVTERSPLVQEFPDNFDLRIPEALAGGVLGRPSGEPKVGGTMEFADGRPPDLLSLPVMADGLAPVVFNLGYPAWTPTLELTIHFWNHPGPGPVSVWIETEVVVGGYHDEHAALWDSQGRLVGRSRQLARILG